jgi:hypothetical protein
MICSKSGEPMLFAANLTREQFIGWLGRSFEPTPVKTSLSRSWDYHRGEVLLVWDREPQRADAAGPAPIISLPDRDLREFFAFVGTYIATYQPFTAFFRVVAHETLREFLRDRPSLPSVDVPNLLVGTLIAEARLHAGERVRSLPDMSIQACLATMSSAAVSAIAAGLERKQLDSVLERWSRLRQALSVAPPRIGSGRIAEFWRLVATIYDRSAVTPSSLDVPAQRIAEFLNEVLTSDDEAAPETWKSLVEGLPGADTALTKMKESREDRVRAMDDLIATVKKAEGVEVTVREAAVGYLASRVGGGSLSYLQLLQPVETFLPISAMWFGLFSSLRNDSDVLFAGNCLGRRVARKLASASRLFEPPQVDISFDEFQAIGMDSPSEIKFRTEHLGAVAVELHPAVKAIFRLPISERRSPPSPSIRSDALRDVRRWLERLARAVDDLDEFPKQKSLFSEPPPRSRYAAKPKPSDK